MVDFLEAHGIDGDFQVVRTRINNERLKLKKRVGKNMKSLLG
jgi:hypothetical protein